MTEPIATIGVQLRALALREPETIAVTCADTSITRMELERASNRLARAYQVRGVGVGDYVSLALSNSIEMLTAMLAVWKLGAVPQPLSLRLPDTEFVDLLELAPRALLVGRPDPRGLLDDVPAGFTADPALSDGPLADAVSPSWKLMASGGSTGRPKLIEATGDSRIDAAQFGGLLGMRAGDTQLVASPLTHNTPFAAATLALLLGQHLVLMPRFDPREFLRLIGRHEVHYVNAVPTILQRVLAVYSEEPASYDLSSIRRMWHMAAPCPPAVKRAWMDILGPEKIWELYGGTEFQAMTFLDGHEWLSHPGSVGRVQMGRMKILDDRGVECPPGEVGEIYLRTEDDAGPSYRYIGTTPTTRDGWDTLGDLGRFDEEGYLYLSDRRVDMFNVGGRKVYPAEVENVLNEHPAVLSCLVVGVPHEDLGQVPYALVQAVRDSELGAEQVRDYLDERIAAYKVPREVEFCDEPLRDDAGKARRSAVRAAVLARSDDSAGPAPSGTITKEA